MSESNFCLKWDEFNVNLRATFSTLRTDPVFTDVTLACRDGQVEVHKVVLAAASTFFANILLKNPHPHPLIYLKDFKAADLSPLLDFMYFGEVEVARDTLEAFLAAAKELQVRGLVEKPEQAGNKTTSSGKMEEDLLAMVEVKEEVFEEESQEECNENQSRKSIEETDEIPSITEWNNLERFCPKSSRKGGRTFYTCSLCGMIGKFGKRSAMEHVESAHFKGTFTYPCDICGSVSKTKCAFRQHMKAWHKQVKATTSVEESDEV